MRSLFLFVVAISITTASLAQSHRKTIDQFLTTLHHNQHFNGNALIAEKGKIIYQQALGLADNQHHTPLTNTHQFPIASITKSMTATAIWQLYEKGLLEVNAPVTTYLPGFPYPAITLTHLMSHTSGLPAYDRYFEQVKTAHPDTVLTNKDILPQFAALHLPLLFEPGSNSMYNNINYIFLALVIEKVAGIPFKQYMQQNIFAPAGMTHTFLPEFAFYHYTPAEKKHLVNLYRLPHRYSIALEKTDTIGFVAAYWHVYNFQGFGEVISTTEDLLHYDQALYNNKLLQPATLALAFTPVALNDGQLNKGNGNGSSFARGWIIESDTSLGKIIRSTGSGIGLRATFIRNISKQQTIVLLDNYQHETDPIGKDLLKIINGRLVKPYRKNAAAALGHYILTKGTAGAASELTRLKNDSSQYYLSEEDINELGYDFLKSDKLNEALETFRLNMLTFPQSWNAYDSYGEILLKFGRQEEAIRMYKRSVELNPDNRNGKKILEELQKPY